MIQLTPHMRTYIAIDSVDFRCQIDGLGYLARTVFQEDPKSGCVFVFKNKSATALKILFYDSRAFWLCHMRLSSGKLRWWPGSADSGTRGHMIDAHELMVLIWNGDPRGVFAKPWRQLDQTTWRKPDERQEEKRENDPRS